MPKNPHSPDPVTEETEDLAAYAVGKEVMLSNNAIATKTLPIHTPFIVNAISGGDILKHFWRPEPICGQCLVAGKNYLPSLQCFEGA